MVKVVCIVNLAALLVVCLGDSVPKVDIYGAVKKKRVTSGFGLQAMIRCSLCVLGPCIFQISCETRPKLA